MKINHYKNLIQFQFPDNGESLGLNIYAYTVDSEAVLIDTAEEEHFDQVMIELNKMGIEVKMVIQTHFHPDHIGGLPKLRHVPIYGSMFAEETLKNFYDDYENYLPTIAVKEEMDIDFRGASFKVIPNPSHSKCTMIVEVDKFSFVGDDCMFFDDESQCMPYCAESVEMHLEGLKLLRQRVEGTLLCPAHGRATKCTMYMKFSIMYFNHILKFPEQSYEEFSDLYKINFKNSKWHRLNTSKVT